jgi:putative transposase
LYRQVKRFSQDLGEEIPSYGTVFNIVRGLPADLVTLAHDGTKAYSETFELVHRREADGPNAIWQADHTPLDILLVRPDGNAAKPWLTVVLDDYSRAVAGYFLSFEGPSVLHTSLVLRQAIWRPTLFGSQLPSTRPTNRTPESSLTWQSPRWSLCQDRRLADGPRDTRPVRGPPIPC